MLRLFFASAVALIPVMTQQSSAPTSAKDAPALGSLKGVVRDSQGLPIAGARVSVGQHAATTSAQGRYVLENLPPGRHGVRVRGEFPYGTSRTVALTSGQEVSEINFVLDRPAMIAGRVLNQQGEPVPRALVSLMTEAYVSDLSGLLRTYSNRSTLTNDLGEYRITTIKPGGPYLLEAKPTQLRPAAISDAAQDPKSRRPAKISTYYYQAVSPVGAERLVLRDGEIREGMDIRLLQSPSYCVEGIVPALSIFRVSPKMPLANISSRFVHIGLDGKFRICDLGPGEYRLTAKSKAGFEFFGTATVTVTDEDVRDVHLPALPLQPLSGEVVWSGEPPKESIESKLTVHLQPVYRDSSWDERETLRAVSSVPGEFAFGGLGMDKYEVHVREIPSGAYLKDITYAGRSIRHGMLPLGNAIAKARLRIILDHNAGTLTIRIADNDGNPVADAYAFVVPADVRSEQELAATLAYGRCDQNGLFRSRALAPDTYRVLAARGSFERTRADIAKLWRARTKGEQVEVSPNASTEMTIEPMELR